MVLVVEIKYDFHLELFLTEHKDPGNTDRGHSEINQRIVISHIWMLLVWRLEAPVLFPLYIDASKIKNPQKQWSHHEIQRDSGKENSLIFSVSQLCYVHFTRLHFIFLIFKNTHVFSKNIRLPLVFRLELLPCQLLWLEKLHAVHSLRQMRRIRVVQSVTLWFCEMFQVSTNMTHIS